MARIRTGAAGPARAISVYDRMCWPDGELERSLAGGAHRRELIAWFGEGEYRRLSTLARAAAATDAAAARGARSRRARPTIYLIPGLLGSQLGWQRHAGQPCDLLWLDATDIVEGRLMNLRWRQRRGSGAARSEAALMPFGAIPYTYLGLKLRLAAAGYRVLVHDYDWRVDIAEIAAGLARRLERQAAERLVLVGHSMGGLVARAALGQCEATTARRIERLIGLGTPHGGSIGAVQALRATYPVVLRLAALDRLNDARALSRHVFHSFVSLYQLLPHAMRTAQAVGKHRTVGTQRSAGTLDLFQATSWPAQGLRPLPRLLAAARRFEASLPGADERFVSIIGTGQRTITGLALRGGQFHYEVSDAGDGTVPALCATLPGARAYSLACEHSELPRNARVAAAIIELAQAEGTRRLRAGIHVRAGRRVHVSDAMLMGAFDHKIDWQRLGPGERRRYLNALNAPPPMYQPRYRAMERAVR